MTKILLATFLFFCGHTAFSQYCVLGGPSSNIDSQLELLQLTGTSGGLNYVGCPGVLGVEEFFSQSTTVNAGGSYVLTVEFGTCGGDYPNVAEVWIDFNANEVFESSESILTWSGTPPMAPGNYVINVPASAMNGQTRMRVIQAEQQQLPLDPCIEFTWGSVTDFLITIENGVDCSTFVGDDFSDPKVVTALPFSESYDNSFCYSNQNPAYSSPDVFYKFSTAGYNSIEVSLCGSSFDTFLSIQDQWGNVIAANDDDPNCGTQSTVNFLTQGYDTLYAIVEGWGNEMGAYTINIGQGTANMENLKLDPYLIKPNPASNAFSIDGAFNGEVFIVNNEGRNVLYQKYTTSGIIDISDLPSGFYIVRLKSNDRFYDKKLIIE